MLRWVWVWVCWSIPPWCLGERKGWGGDQGGVRGCILKSRLVLVLSRDGVRGPECVWGGRESVCLRTRCGESKQETVARGVFRCVPQGLGGKR